MNSLIISYIISVFVFIYNFFSLNICKFITNTINIFSNKDNNNNNSNILENNTKNTTGIKITLSEYNHYKELLLKSNDNSSILSAIKKLDFFLASMDLINFLDAKELETLINSILKIAFFSLASNSVSDEIRANSSLLVSNLIIKGWFNPNSSEETIKLLEETLACMYNCISNPEKVEFKQTEVAVLIFMHFGNAKKEYQKSNKIHQFQNLIDKVYQSSLDLHIKLGFYEAKEDHCLLRSNTYNVLWSLYDSISDDFIPKHIKSQQA
ncbi:hypothetical protein DICPUDRAFT_85015 [Dictyostelium purpureum]|uniref:PUL domain-containing protein n=1 Tax=Dictyostelium purpureum TaxID=5786 RepID=F1A4F0_DICPU|nr:uncharacterized protein DICPUDRAFT_85015 [Dictyostelium purpureum]EGC28931.1 hypothetical protein DICPUDRAFT_85015 [Dictyostelium purpureum]|eukprot:XP_003294545.1 hypothetical protein DICPUDRAFT_85015 [Dictyostelium purpureum]